MPQPNREDFERRLALLVKEREQLQAQAVQLQADLNAYNGAILDCEFWLKKFDEPEPNEK